MLKDHHRRPVPQWLADLDLSMLAAPMDRPLPLRDILTGSLYYPACGFDGRPIQFLGGFVHSFVYADYGVGIERLNEELHQASFDGYVLVGRRAVAASELTTGGGCSPASGSWPLVTREHPGYRMRRFMQPFFAEWLVFERHDSRDEGHGPPRFSLLYIGADGVETYRVLYKAHDLAPEVLAIIQPGTGFGGNYTDFRDPGSLLAEAVLKGSVGVTPEYLVYGGMLLGYFEACWPEHYPEHVEWWQHHGGNGVWRRAADA